MEGRWQVTEKELNELTERIIGCAFTVANGLGSGFLEKVYENALAHELRKHRLRADQQSQVAVHYDGVVVGEYFADILVEETVIVELKAAREINDARTSPVSVVFGLFQELIAHSERQAASAPAEAEQRDGLQASAIDYDVSSKTGFCGAMPRIRAVSNSAIEPKTSKRKW